MLVDLDVSVQQNVKVGSILGLLQCCLIRDTVVNGEDDYVEWQDDVS